MDETYRGSPLVPQAGSLSAQRPFPRLLMIPSGHVDLTLGDVHLEGRQRQLADLGQRPDRREESGMSLADPLVTFFSEATRALP
jgi:hypothetical protein